MDFSKHLSKADEALKRRNHDYAIELYRQLIDLDPDLGEARAGLRRALRARSERAGGGRLGRIVGGAVPLARAKTLRKMGKLDACARALEDYLAKQPLDEDANLSLGEVLEEAGHRSSARAVYEFLAEIAPDNPVGLKRAGAMLREAGEAERALECYERALRIDPRDREALKARKDLAAEDALRSNEREEVRHSRDLEKRPAEADASGQAGGPLRGSGDPAAGSGPGSGSGSGSGIGGLAEERERLEASIAAAATPDADAIAALSDLCRRLGDQEAARDHAERALALDPRRYAFLERVGDLETKELRRVLAQAASDEEAERAEAALRAHQIEDLRARIALRPSDPDLQLGLGRQLMRAGDLEGAIAAFQGVQSDPRVRGEALFLLARCWTESGLPDLARKGLTAALDEAAEGSERFKDILYDLGLLAEAQGDAEEARSFYVRIFEIDIGYRDVAQKMKAR